MGISARGLRKSFVYDDGVMRRFIFCFGLLSALACFLTVSSLAYADSIPNPGDQFVFGADSPLNPDGNLQNGPALSDMTFLWNETEPFYTSYRQRIYFKHFNTPNAQAKPLIEGELSGSSPAISHDARADGTKRVVWTEYSNETELNGTTRWGNRIFYKDVDFSNASTCPGTVDQCASMVFPDSDNQMSPSVSPDGSKIIWEDQTTSPSQIHFYDFNSGISGIVPSIPSHDLSGFTVDNQWVVWTEEWNYNLYHEPIDSAIYAWRIGSADPPERIAFNGGTTAAAGVKGSRLGRDQAGNSVVLYSSFTSNDSNITWAVHQYNLVSGTDQTITQKTTSIYLWTSLEFPSMDNDKIIWTECNGGSRCTIELHNMTTNITQPVTQAPIIDSQAQLANSSGFICWQNTGQSSSQIYYNRIGATEQQLADKYLPELKLQGGPQPNVNYDNTPIPENFQPMPVEQFLTDDTFLMQRALTANNVIYLKKLKQDPTAQDLAALSQYSGLYIDLSRGDSIATGGGTLSVSNPHLSINQELLKDDYVMPYLNRTSMFPKTVYTRIVSRPDGNSNSFIQYWIFYYANDFPEEFHEGDWELIQIDLDDNLNPYCAAYSQHGGGQFREWNDIEKAQDDPFRVVSYVAKGSHANYFKSGDQYNVFTESAAVHFWDSAQGGGVILNNPVDSNPDNKTTSTVIPEVDQSGGTQFEWLQYNGQWGQFTNATVGFWPDPQLNGYRDGSDNPPVQNYWQNGFNWGSCDGCQDETASQTDLEVTKHSPVDIRIYDSSGRVMAKNLGPNDIPIPNAEYLDYPELDRASIVIHGGNITDGYRIEADGTSTGTAGLTLTAPDHASGSVDTLNYDNIQVNPATKISMNLDGGKNYNATVDEYGDGTSVSQKAPDTTNTNTVDFTPPAQITDLAGSAATYGSVALNFTAPGDDGAQGTATAYDLRYSTSAISDQYWNQATPASGLPKPLPGGSSQTITVDGLTPGVTYNFALKTMDDAGLISPTSNVVTVYVPTDSTAPVISNLAPSGWINSSSPTITANYTDPGLSSGINESSAIISLNGGAAAACSATGGAMSCPLSGLAEDNYNYTLSVTDNAGNIGNASGNFKVDKTGPTISDLLPGGYINTNAPTVTATYADSGAGVNSASA